MVLNEALMALSTLFMLAAIYYSALLSKETKGEKYWVFFLIAALAFGVLHILSKLGTETAAPREIAEIVGAFSLAYACFGLYTSMKKFRQKVGKELQ